MRWRSVHRIGWALFLALLMIGSPRPAAGGDEWMMKIPTAPAVTPPFERKLSAGQILRMKVQKDKAMKVRGRNVVLRPYRNGKPAGRETTLSGGSATLWWSTVEADEIILYSRKRGKVKAEAGVMPEATVEAGNSVRLPVSPGKQIAGRFVNLDSGHSMLTYSFQAGGEDLPYGQIGPPGFRTVVLPHHGDYSQKTWKSTADSFVVQVKIGRIHVKLGQPFP